MGGFVDIAATIKQPESPISQLSGALALKSQVQQQQMGQVQLEQAQQEQRSSATLMRIFAQNNGDMNQTLADSRASGQIIPSHLLDFQTKSKPAEVQAQQQNDADLAKAVDESKGADSALLSMPSPDEARAARAANLLKTQVETAAANASAAKSRAETELMGAKPVVAFGPATN